MTFVRMCLEARDEFRESIQDYTKAVSLGYHLALADCGRVHEKMGDLHEAAADYLQALQSGPTGSRDCSNVRSVAVHRAMQPGDFDADLHTGAVSLLLEFMERAVARAP